MLRIVGYRESLFRKKSGVDFVVYAMALTLISVVGAFLLVRFSTFEGCIVVSALGVIFGILSFAIDKQQATNNFAKNKETGDGKTAI